MTCKICCEEIKRRHKYISCAVCQYHIHIKCAGITDEENKIITLKKSIKYICGDCDENYCVKNLFEQIKELKDAMKNCMNVVEENSKIINEMNSNKIENKKISYANVLKKDNEKIVVKPIEEQACYKTTEDVKQKINPVKLAVGIENVKNLRNGSIMISCNDKVSKEKIKNKVECELGDKYQVEDVKMKMPKIILINAEEDYIHKTDEEVIKDIMEQNDLDEEVANKLKVIKKYKRQNKRNCGNIIFQINGEEFMDLMKRKTLFIGWRQCNIFEYHSIVRCFNCGGYNNFKDKCTKPLTCPRCADALSIEECNENKPLKCINSLNAVQKTKIKLDCQHAATDRNCPSYIRQLKRETNKIDYKT